MKKIYLTLLLAFITVVLSAQPWLANLPSDKSKKDLTLNDYRKAFEAYWAPKNVKDGYYFQDGVKLKAAGWKQFKRWEYQMESEVDPSTGRFPEKSAQQVYEEYISTVPVTDFPLSSNWSVLGPNSTGGGYAGLGRLNCIAFHPSNTNTYWVGAAAGGCWVTYNNGVSWTCLTDNNAVLAVSDIFIPPDFATSNTIYIATGDKDHYDNRSIGVLKSTNGGTTWSTTGLNYLLTDNKMVFRLLADPANSQTILAATSSGVFKTTNGGTTWNTMLTSTAFIDLEYKPGDFNTLYGSTTSGKIYYSANGGTTWTQSFNNTSAARIELAVSPNQSAWVYALAASSANSGLYGVYRSTDNGVNFTQMISGTTMNLLGWSSDGSDAGGQGWYDLALAVSPSNANTIFTGGVNTWRSTDGGTSWTLSNHWTGSGAAEVHADKHTLNFRNTDLFECNDGGVYISSDNGNNWTDKTNSLVISQMYKLGVGQLALNENITGLQDNGTKLLSAGTWTDEVGGDGMECLIDHTDINVQYGELYYGSIYRTTNHWGNATNIKPSATGDGAWVTPYIIDPNNAQTLYAGFADVWKSTNRGTSWTKISTMASGSNLRSMAIAPSNSQYLYVADVSKIWKTTNGGTSWTEITGTLPIVSGNITSIAVKNDDFNTLWVTLSGYNTNRVFQSVNGGTTWTNISTGMPNLPAYSVVQNKQITSEVHLYVGTEVGVYFKKGTDNWVPFNTGLPNVKIGELEIYYATLPQNSKLRAATFGRGLWESNVEWNCTPVPVPTISGTSTSCAGTTGVIYTTEAGMTGYNWNVSPGGAITAGAATNQITVTWNTAGAQTVSVNYFNSNGCTSPFPTVKNVTVNTLPVPSVSGLSTVCAGSSGVTYTTEPGMTGYSWTISSGGIIAGGSGTNQVSVTWNSPGAQTISVNYTNAGLCAAPAPTVYPVTVNPQPLAVITPTGPTTFCQGNSVTLTATAASSYLWSNGETTQSITVSASGNFYVTVSNSFGCQATSSSVAVVVNANPVANAGTDQSIVYGASTTLSGSATGGTGSYSWHWEPSSYLINANIQNPVTTNLTTTQVFTLTATNVPNGCFSNDQVMVTVTGGPLSVDATVSPETSCAGDQVQLLALGSGGSGSNTYSWSSIPAGFNSTIYNPVANPSVNTEYFVNVSDGITTVTDSVTVTVIQIPGQPLKPAGPDLVDLNFITQSVYTAVAVPFADSYQWDLSPAAAGTISGTGLTGTVLWNIIFTGNAEVIVRSINECGESVWSEVKNTVVENTSTGISITLEENKVTVYPNPAESLVTVEFSDPGSPGRKDFVLYNIQGELVKKISSSAQKTRIDISDLAAGVYFIFISTENGNGRIRFVKI